LTFGDNHVQVSLSEVQAFLQKHTARLMGNESGAVEVKPVFVEMISILNHRELLWMKASQGGR